MKLESAGCPTLRQPADSTVISVNSFDMHG